MKGKREVEQCQQCPENERNHLVKEIYGSCFWHCSSTASITSARAEKFQGKIVMSAGCEKETVHSFHTNSEAEPLFSVRGSSIT